jgi:hypothetical protein
MHGPSAVVVPISFSGGAAMILEGLVTTTDDAGDLHVAAMGPAVDEAERAGNRLTRLVLRPFATSHTATHLLQRPQGVFHLTDDVLLLARLAVGDPVAPAARPAGEGGGWIRDDASAAWEFVIEATDASSDRLHLEARVVATHQGRPFFGFNRAAHAVVEGAILVTRLHLLGAEEVGRRLADLEPLVAKTGGRRERQAFGLLTARAASS